MEALGALLGIGLLIISLVATVAVGIYISESRGRNPAEGVALGCILGPLGYWIALLLPDRTPPVAPYVPLDLRPIGAAPAVPEPARPEARYFVGASPEDAARQARDWCRERQNSGFLVTETDWMDPDRRTLAVAIGRPGQPYAPLARPTRRVRDDPRRPRRRRASGVRLARAGPRGAARAARSGSSRPPRCAPHDRLELEPPPRSWNGRVRCAGGDRSGPAGPGHGSVMMVGRGRVFVLTVALAIALPAGAAVGQAPSPSLSPSASPAVIALRPADNAEDDAFHLEIRADTTQFVADGPPIQVDTTLAYIGDEQHITVSHAGGGIVAFGVRQLDGPFDPGGPGRRMSLQFDQWSNGEGRGVPFGKSGGFSADDPLAEAYRAWFADPMIHLGPGTYEITAQAEYGLDGEAVDRTLEASVIVEVAPGPSERPFTAPLVPRLLDNPDLSERWEPDGPPDATVVDRGVRYELWLSTRELAPGDWLQGAVRATNVSEDPVWQFGSDCGRYASQLTTTATRRPFGAAWTGAAGDFKRRALRVGGASPNVWLQPVTARAVQPILVLALAECGGSEVPPLVRLAPGASRTERFVGYAGARVDNAGRYTEALTPGTITVTARWPWAGRGPRPAWTFEDDRPAPVAVQVPVRLTGSGPTTRPLGELVDAALADAAFRSWVDAHPDGTGWEVTVERWPGPSYTNPRWATVRERAIFGMTELSLYHSGHAAHALLDTWTGDLLDVVFE